MRRFTACNSISTVRGASFVVTMIIIACLALFLRIAILQFIKINIALNESDAQSTLKLMSTALENYSKNNNNTYPAKFSLLTQTRPPYLDRDYLSNSPIKGYRYSCSRLENASYGCTAIPVKCDITGKMTYSVTTGGVLVWEYCAKKY